MDATDSILDDWADRNRSLIAPPRESPDPSASSSEDESKDYILSAWAARNNTPRGEAATTPEPAPAPAATAPSSAPKPEDMGFWDVTRKAAGRGFVGGMQEFGAGAAAPVMGFRDAAKILPEHQQDEVERLLNQGVMEGYGNPKWWGAHLAHGITSASPSMATGLAGAGLGTALEGGVPGPGTLLGGAAGFGIGSALQTATAAWARYKAQGLPDEAAADMALKESGISGAFGTAMGLMPGLSFYGRAGAEALRRPFLEFLTQMGLAQPGLGAGQQVATAALQGRTVTPDELLTGYVNMVGVGGAYTGLHWGASHLLGVDGKPKGLSDEATRRAYEGLPSEEPLVTPPPPKLLGFRGPEAYPETAQRLEAAAGPDKGKQFQALFEEPIEIATSASRKLDPQGFFSQAREIVDSKGPNSASGGQWLSTLRNNGARDEELEFLKLPQYLADSQGKISKGDLLAHIEMNQIQLEERVNQFDSTREALYGTQTLPGEKGAYREILMKMPMREEETLPRGWQVRQFPNGEWGVHNDVGHLVGDTHVSKEMAFKEALGAAQRGDPSAAGFRTKGFYSEHWEGEPNVLAHVRTTDRVDRDGRRTLFVEEIQSDWHQKGREKGYKQEPMPLKDRPAAIERLHELERQHDAIRGSRDIPEGFRLRAEMNDLRRQIMGAEGVPKAPFKTSWPELAFKRLMRFAADRGYERIAWTNGEQQIARYRTLSELQQNGMREFYGTPGNLRDFTPPRKGMIDRIAEKWAKKLGAGVGDTRVVTDFEQLRGQKGLDLAKAGTALGPVRYMDVSPAVGERIQMGLPIFSRKPEVRVVEGASERGFTEQALAGTRMGRAARQAANAIQDLADSMKLAAPLEIRLLPRAEHQGGRALGLMKTYAYSDGSRGYVIEVSVLDHKAPEELFATMAHEFGHIVMLEHFERASPAQKAAIMAAFDEWKKGSPPTQSFLDMLHRRDNAITSVYQSRGPMEHFDYPMLALTPERQRYWTSMEEWFAEQVARWATTSQKPLSIVERYFKELGDRIRQIISSVRSKLGLETTDPHKVMKDWLDSFVETSGPFAADAIAGAQYRTRMEAQRAFARDGTPEVPPSDQTIYTGGARSLMGKIFKKGEEPENWEADAAHADRMNKFYQTMISMPQLAEVNPHHKPLQYYKEKVQVKDAEEKSLNNTSMEILHGLVRLGNKQETAMWGMLEDYALMNHLTKEEIAKKQFRKPSLDEFAELAKKHGVDDRGIAAFQKITGRMDEWMRMAGEQLKVEARRISDPSQRAEALMGVDAKVAEMRRTPFFPFMRFGDHFLTVRDKAGNILHSEQFATRRKRDQAAEEIQTKLQNGETIRRGVMSKDARPFFGMPRGMLDLIGEKLSLSDKQRAALEELRFQQSPAEGFRHRFQVQDRTPGYATDFRRVFANFEFFAAKQFSRVKHVDGLRDLVRQAKEQSKDPKGDQIANFMSDHLQHLLDPKPDFAALRALAFTWYLAYSPAAATLNLSQTILMSYPFLATHFGDLKALGAMGRASTRLSTFYRKATLEKEMTDRELKALGEGVRMGTITEALAPQLAATAEGRNLSQGFGGNALERMANTFNRWGSFFFEHTEQTNRRIVFRAAYNLAMEHPETAYVKRVKESSPLQYKGLVDRGYPENEAAAIITAKHATEATQFIYSPYARPKFMRGKAGSLFVFKSFTQNTLFTMWNYPGVAVRSLLILGFLGGLMGMPGAEDMNGILRAIGFHLFGKDWDLQDQAREFALGLFGGKGEKLSHPGQLRTDEGSIRPDLLLHGMSRVGYGIPAILDMMGNLAGKEHIPFPVSDRHANIGMGNILPVEPGVLLAPQITGMGASGGKDVSGQALRETQRASGAIFGLGFALYKAIMNSQLDWTDAKRWEGIVPTALRNASQSFRYYSERKERSRSGAAVVRFDPNEPEQMMEILAKAGGWGSARLSAQYDRITAEREAEAFWDLRRQGLLRQAWTARNSGDPESYSKVLGAIRKYNAELPVEARGKAITGDTMAASFRTKAQSTARQESGIPLANQNIPLSRHIQQMFPEAQVGAGRKVR